MCGYVRFTLSDEVIVSAISYQYSYGEKYENSEPYLDDIYIQTSLPAGAEWVASSQRTVYRYSKYYFYDSAGKKQSGAWWYADGYATKLKYLDDSWDGLYKGCGKYNLELTEETETNIQHNGSYYEYSGDDYWGKWVIVYGRYKIYN